jgi:hypothetical protein
VTANSSLLLSWEETRIHVHVSHMDDEAKFWLVFQLRNFDKRKQL